LMAYDWPGNIRELKNVIERAVYRNSPHIPVHQIVLDPFDSKFRPQTRIRAKAATTSINNETEAIASPVNQAPESIPADSSTNDPNGVAVAHKFPLDFKHASQSFEINLIQQALADAQFNQKKTAERLGLTYHQLRGYLKKYNLLDASKH
ncbi:MAG: helix-turn-helix domain-containing protein, partial [Pseudomonadota bacterium]